MVNLNIMARPHKEYRSDIFPKDQQFTYTDIPHKPLWQNEFHYVTKLLEQKLLNYIRLNERLRDNINNLSRFLQVTEKEISFNLTEFKDGYQFKFIIPDFETYCAKFIELFTPVLTDFLKEIKYSGYGFTFKLRLGGNTFEKRKSIMINQNDE